MLTRKFSHRAGGSAASTMSSCSIESTMIVTRLAGAGELLSATIEDRSTES